MKVSEQFKSTIKAYLDNMAAVDSLFAPVYQKPTKKEVCRNARCTSFFVHHYTNLFTFFKLRSFEDFFDLCVPSI